MTLRFAAMSSSLQAVRRCARAALAVASLVATALAGCAGYSPSQVQPGQTVDDVTRSMGTPTGRYAMPDGGERLEFARGPYGKHTFMVDVDPQGRVTGWTQVLEERNFNEIRTGMTRDEVLRFIGRPSETERIGRQRLTTWSYRYSNPFCIWFQVSMNDEGRVAATGHGIDPICGNVREGVNGNSGRGSSPRGRGLAARPLRGEQLPKHERQDAAMAVVVHLDRRVDAQHNPDLLP
jgi:hypothetical protein